MACQIKLLHSRYIYQSLWRAHTPWYHGESTGNESLLALHTIINGVIDVSTLEIESDVVYICHCDYGLISANGLKEEDGQNICCGDSVHIMETAPFSLIYYIYQYDVNVFKSYALWFWVWVRVRRSLCPNCWLVIVHRIYSLVEQNSLKFNSFQWSLILLPNASDWTAPCLTLAFQGRLGHHAG